MSWIIDNTIPEQVCVAWFELENVTVRDQRPELQAELAARGEELRSRHPDPASAAPLFAASRRLYHGFGLDPSKTRPSSEALVRRILQGKGLFTVNTAVDAANLTSIRHHRSVGLYDAGKIRPEIVPAGPGGASGAVAASSHRVILRPGREGEQYPGIGKEMIHLHGRPALFDLEGPFGNPSADSDRTKVTLETRSLLFVLYEPPGQPEEEVRSRLKLSWEILRRHVGGEGGSEADR